MIWSIIYKEYLKTYKVIFIFFVIFAFVLFNTFLDAKNAFEYKDATSAVLGIIYSGKFNFNYIEYILPIFTICLGIAQFYPEVSNARIRLYLHLPLSHLSLVSISIFIGLIFIAFVFFIISFIYSYILNDFYPVEIFDAVFSKLFPMFLSSFLCYLTTMIAFLEPKNIKKVLYILLSVFTLMLYKDIYMSSYFMSSLIDFVLIGIIAIYILSVYEVFASYTKGYIK